MSFTLYLRGLVSMKTIVLAFLLCLYLSGCTHNTGYTPSYILSDATQEASERVECDHNAGAL